MATETNVTEEALEATTAQAIAEADAAVARAAAEADAVLDASSPEHDDEELLAHEPRLLMTVGATVVAAALMTGGIFIGATPRIYGALAGVAGLFIARQASRARSPWALYGWVAGGLFMTGIVLVGFTGLDSIPQLGKLLREASSQGDLLRPPVLFQPGWHAILGWTMGCVGFAAGWLALELRKPAIGLLIPVPVVAFAAVSVPKSQQLLTGLGCLVLLAAGFALLSGLHERGTEDEAPDKSYEMRRAMRAIPLVGGVTIALYFASQSNLLFPPPIYDPSQQARLPRRIPLTEVKDRVLFEVKANFSGPWKMGTLDVYDGHDWRLPPYNDDLVKEVPESGVVEGDLTPEVSAAITIRGLAGAVLPGLANTVGLVAELPKDMKVSFDKRAGLMRVTQGQMRAGFKYTMVAAGVPRLEQLRSAEREVPEDVRPFLKMPRAPQAVADLLRQAPTANMWDRIDFLRKRVLDKVEASGAGEPISITADRVDEMLTTNPTATPFEIVAAQAMLARWAGVPARIGYGFDGGEPGADKKTLFIRPKHGALFMEVYFPHHGWLPIIGTPRKAKADLADGPQQFSNDVSASNEISINLIIPELEAPRGELFRSIRRVLGATAPAALGVFLCYVLWPLPYKGARRARRRTWANRRGPTARIALAYAEWRDMVTDFGYTYSSDPPLMFLKRFAPDDEHAELAWLVNRALWGDLQGEVTVDDAVAAEELSASLRQRLGRAHPFTLRLVASLSRLSIRTPYAPALGMADGASRESLEEDAHVA